MSEKPTVLFVCVHNAGRSQMAAGYLQHLAVERRGDAASDGAQNRDMADPLSFALVEPCRVQVDGELGGEALGAPTFIARESARSFAGQLEHSGRSPLDLERNDGDFRIVWLRTGRALVRTDRDTSGSQRRERGRVLKVLGQEPAEPGAYGIARRMVPEHRQRVPLLVDHRDGRRIAAHRVRDDLGERRDDPTELRRTARIGHGADCVQRA